MTSLRHATPAHNLNSIFRHGLLTAKSRGARKAVWLHSPALSAWAAIHTAKRHHVGIDGVAIIEVEVPRSALRRSRKGLWYTTQDVGPERLGAARGTGLYATAIRVA
jgi:hypothetical protein